MKEDSGLGEGGVVPTSLRSLLDGTVPYQVTRPASGVTSLERGVMHSFIAFKSLESSALEVARTWKFTFHIPDFRF